MGSASVRPRNEEVNSLSRLRVFYRGRVASKRANFLHDLGCVTVDRYDAFGVELSQRYVQAPSIFRYFSQGIEFEIQKFLTSQARCSHEEEGCGDQRPSRYPITLSKVFLQSPVGLC